MKRVFVILLAAVMCFSLGACAKSSESEKYETYKSLIDYLEAEDYESALAEIVRISENDKDADAQEDGEQGDTQQSKAEPEAHTVEITLDNWQEYLEINQYLSVYCSTNSFDEVTGTYLELLTILEPKKEYSKVETWWEDSDRIAVEYDMDYCVSDIIYNLDDFSFELIDCVSHPEVTVDEDSFVRGRTSHISTAQTIFRYRIVDGKLERDSIEYAMNLGKKGMELIESGEEGYIQQNGDGTGYIAKCPTNIRITRIQGTLKYYD